MLAAIELNMLNFNYTKSTSYITCIESSHFRKKIHCFTPPTEMEYRWVRSTATACSECMELLIDYLCTFFKFDLIESNRNPLCSMCNLQCTIVHGSNGINSRMMKTDFIFSLLHRSLRIFSPFVKIIV